jgi:hypothetical protein
LIFHCLLITSENFALCYKKNANNSTSASQSPIVDLAVSSS